MIRRLRSLPGLLFLIPLAFFALFFVYPLAAVVGRTIFPAGAIDLSFISEILSDSYLRGVLGFTFGQALLSAGLSVVLGVPLGYILGRYRFPLRRLCMVLFTIPFMLPAIVVAVALRTLFARGSLTGELFPVMGTVGIILIAHLYYNLGLVIRLTASFWSHLSPVYAEAARVLGSSNFQRAVRIYLPLILPVLLGSFLLVFLYCFGSFGIILLLGGQGMSSIEVEIYRSTVNLLDFRVAGGLAIFQLVMTLGLGLIYRSVTRRLTVGIAKVPSSQAMVPLSSARHRYLYLSILLMGIAFILAPLAAVAGKAFFSNGHFTMLYFTELFYNRSSSLFFTSPILAIRNSLSFATWTAAVSVGFALVVIRAADRRWIGRVAGTLAWLPLGTSAVTLGLGFMLTPFFRDARWIGSPESIIALHTVIAFPFVLSVLLPAFRSIDPALLEAGAVLGAGSGERFRRIVVPLMARSIVVAVCYGLLISLGEFGATLMLSRPETVTLPVAINRLLSQPGTLNFGKAMAESMLLVMVTGVLVGSIERFSQEGAD